MQYIDLQPFEDFVRSRNLVDERHLPFYLKWVLRFLRSEFDRERLSSSDLLQCFSDQLARDERLEDWQRRQAVKATELYLNIYLPEANGMAHGVEGMGSGGERSEDGGQNVDAVSSPRFLNIGNSGKAGATPAVQNDEQQALREMKELMKLRHYSPRTLQTYTEWAQRYFGYAKGHKLAWDAPESIRVWLSSLATQRHTHSPVADCPPRRRCSTQSQATRECARLCPSCVDGCCQTKRVQCRSWRPPRRAAHTQTPCLTPRDTRRHPHAPHGLPFCRCSAARLPACLPANSRDSRPLAAARTYPHET